MQIETRRSTHFLFVYFAFKFFSRRLNRLIQEVYIKHYVLPCGSPLVTHLAFADDLILFAHASHQSLGYLFLFLIKYEHAPGQRVSKAKACSFRLYIVPELRRTILFLLAYTPLPSHLNIWAAWFLKDDIM